MPFSSIFLLLCSPDQRLWKHQNRNLLPRCLCSGIPRMHGFRAGFLWTVPRSFFWLLLELRGSVFYRLDSVWPDWNQQPSQQSFSCESWSFHGWVCPDQGSITARIELSAQVRWSLHRCLGRSGAIHARHWWLGLVWKLRPWPCSFRLVA